VSSRLHTCYQATFLYAKKKRVSERKARSFSKRLMSCTVPLLWEFSFCPVAAFISILIAAGFFFVCISVGFLLVIFFPRAALLPLPANVCNTFRMQWPRQQIRRIVKGQAAKDAGRRTGTATSVLVGGNGGVRSPATTPRAKSEIRSASPRRAGKHMQSAIYMYIYSWD